MFKILLIGNSAVGKSSLLLRFADEIFHETFFPTIGVDFKIRTIEQAGGSLVKLQMWDTAGQEKFKHVTSSYYKGAQGIVLVFDLCDRKSFQDVKGWMAEIEKHSNLESVRVLVGNKFDLEGRQVGKEEAQQFAENEGMIYYEASAKLNLNVDTIFLRLAAEMKEKFSRPYIEKYKRTSTYLSPLASREPKNPTKTCC